MLSAINKFSPYLVTPQNLAKLNTVSLLAGGSIALAICSKACFTPTELRSHKWLWSFAALSLNCISPLIGLIAQLIIFKIWDPYASFDNDKKRNEALFYVALSGNLNLVQWLLGKYPQALLDAKDNQGRTLFHFAVLSGNLNLVQWLLDKYLQAFLDAKDSEGRTPFLYAAAFDQLAVVQHLISLYPGTVNLFDDKGRIPSHYAMARNNLDVVNFLLTAKSVSTDTKDGQGRTLMHIAAANGHLAAIQNLQKLGADVNAKDSQGQTPLHLAAANGHPQVIQLLQEFGADLQAKDWLDRTPVDVAQGQSRLKLIMLLANNDNLNDCEWVFLATGSKILTEEIYELISHKVQAQKNFVKEENSIGQTLFHLAAANGHPQVIQLLQTFGANLEAQDSEGRTPFHLAAANGHLEVIQLLQTFGANLEAQDSEGRTPFHLAAANGHPQVIRLLQEFGAHLQAKDSEGRTPLHLAAANGHPQVIRLLQEFGANLEAQDSEGRTPLHLAAANGHLEVIKQLQRFGADVNAQDKDGNTPLHLAVQEGRELTVHWLVQQGKANIEAQDKDGNTPLHLAAANGRPAVIFDRELVAKFLLNGRRHLLIIQNSQGDTPFDVAIKEKRRGIIDWCIRNCLDQIIFHDEYREGILHLAMYYASLETLESLLESYGREVSILRKYKEKTALQKVIRALNVEQFNRLVTFYLDELVQASKSVNETSTIHLYLVAQYGSLAHFQTLAKPFLSSEDLTSDIVWHLFKHIVSDDNNLEKANWLFDQVNKLHLRVTIDFNARKGKKDQTLLHSTVINNPGGHKMLHWLCEKGADRDIEDAHKHRPIEIAARVFRYSAVITLQSIGAEFRQENLINGEGDTLFHLFLRKRLLCEGDVSRLCAYLREGESALFPLQVANTRGEMPLHLAVRTPEKLELAALIIEKTENPSPKDSQGQMPVHHAAANGCLSGLILLHDHKADLEAQDSQGRTPCHLAAENGHLDVLKLLQTLGANVNPADNEGLTPFHLAAKNNHLALTDYLSVFGPN